MEHCGVFECRNTCTSTTTLSQPLLFCCFSALSSPFGTAIVAVPHRCEIDGMTLQTSQHILQKKRAKHNREPLVTLPMSFSTDPLTALKYHQQMNRSKIKYDTVGLYERYYNYVIHAVLLFIKTKLWCTIKFRENTYLYFTLVYFS